MRSLSRRETTSRTAWITAAVLLLGCRSQEDAPPAPVHEGTVGLEATSELVTGVAPAGADTNEIEAAAPNALLVRAPVDAESQYTATIDYLLDRYDVDGDGRVQAAEYERGEEAFGRLDRDKDGALSAADFRVPERGNTAERMRRMGGAIALAQYFQSDDDPAVFTDVELEGALVRYDTDGDERIDEAEFTCAYEAHAVDLPDSGMARMIARRLGDSTPWEAVLAADADADGALGMEEAVDFFEASGAAQMWARFAAPRESSRGAGDARRGGARASERDPGGPPAGERAPDFTLTSLDGEDEVTLSSFAGEKPVALVFGSYT